MPIAPAQLVALETSLAKDVLLWRFSNATGLTGATISADGNLVNNTSSSATRATTDTKTVTSTKAIIPRWERIGSSTAVQPALYVSIDGGTTYSPLVNGQRFAFAIPQTSLKFAFDLTPLNVGDDFNRANGAVGTATSGQVWQLGGNTTLAINANRLDGAGLAGTNPAWLETQTNDVNYEISVDYQNSGNRQGIVWRLVNTSNYYRVLFNASNTLFQQVVNGVVTTISTTGAIATGSQLRWQFLHNPTTHFLTIKYWPLSNPLNITTVHSGVVAHASLDAGTGVGVTSDTNLISFYDNLSAFISGLAPSLSFFSVFLEH